MTETTEHDNCPHIHSISYISEANAQSRGYGATRDYAVGGANYPGMWVLETDGEFVRDLHVNAGIKTFWAGRVAGAKDLAEGFLTLDGALDGPGVVGVEWVPDSPWCPARDFTARFVTA